MMRITQIYSDKSSLFIIVYVNWHFICSSKFPENSILMTILSQAKNCALQNLTHMQILTTKYIKIRSTNSENMVTDIEEN